MQFDQFSIDHRVLKNLAVRNLVECTDVQELSIPAAMAGQDLLISSKTGSGKTLAYLIPAVHRVFKQRALSPKDPRVLVLAPTRELAKQIYGELKWLAVNTNVSAALLIGGENFNDQVKKLKSSPQFIIGTAGRVVDHLNGRSLYLNGLELLILDEADRMLDLGFQNALLDINQAADHRKRQTWMYSATLQQAEMYSVSQRLLKSPKTIHIDDSSLPHQDIKQTFYLADHLDHKQALLINILQRFANKQSIVFTATRIDTERLATLLNQKNLNSISLSGDKNQAKRNQTTQSFRQGQHQILVTTDVASRGLDLLNVGLVINFDMPKFPEEYVHRIGRTGRKGQQGSAISLISSKDAKAFGLLKQFLKQDYSFAQIEGLEPKLTEQALFNKNKQSNVDITKQKPTTHKVKQVNTKGQRRVNTMSGSEVGHLPIRKIIDIDE